MAPSTSNNAPHTPLHPRRPSRRMPAAPRRAHRPPSQANPDAVVAHLTSLFDAAGAERVLSPPIPPEQNEWNE